MSKRTRIILIILALAVVAYFAYRWWQNRNSGGLQGNTSGTGSNLNSLAPSLVAGSSGPNSGLNYYPGNTQIDVTLPTTSGAASSGGGKPKEPEDEDKDKKPVHKPKVMPVFKQPKTRPRKGQPVTG